MFTAMLAQLLMTFIAGLFFGFVRMKIKSIVPIMIFHWFWDFNLIGGQVLGIGKINDNYTTTFVLFEIAFVVIYLPYFIYKENKKKTKKKKITH